MVAASPSVLPIHRLTVEQYHAMRDTRILTADDDVELLEGIIVPKMTKKPPHRLATHLVRKALERVVPPGYYVDSQEPITTDDSEPEPDAVVVRGSPRNYPDRHPGANDAVVVIEVADDSLERDREKGRVYARAGIPEYWIVNLRGRAVEVYTEPRDGKYESRRDQVGGTLMVTLDDGQVGPIEVDSLLP